MPAKKTTIPATQVRRLQAVLDAEIAWLRGCRPLLATVHPDLLSAGREALGTDRQFAVWACTPARCLRWRSPIVVGKTKAGRAQVIILLRAIQQGRPSGLLPSLGHDQQSHRT